MAVFLTVATIELIHVPSSGLAAIAPLFAQQLLIGLAVGWALGRVLPGWWRTHRLQQGPACC